MGDGLDQILLTFFQQADGQRVVSAQFAAGVVPQFPGLTVLPERFPALNLLFELCPGVLQPPQRPLAFLEAV